MLKYCAGVQAGSVFARCKNKPVITRDAGSSYWSGFPESEQGLCRRHAQERINKAVHKADLLRKKLAKV